MVTATGHSKKVSGHSLVMANKGLQVVDIQLLVIVVIVYLGIKHKFRTNELLRIPKKTEQFITGDFSTMSTMSTMTSIDNQGLKKTFAMTTCYVQGVLPMSKT